MKLLSRFACAATLAIFAVAAQAAEWAPKRPVRLIVPFPPGGAVDAIARVIVVGLPERLGQQVVVDNRGGANGIIGSELTARAVPDGQTILIVPNAHAIAPTVTRKLPYDTLRDFAPITQVGNGAYVLVVSPSLPVKTVGDFVSLAKSRGQFSYAFTGHGNATQLAGELFKLLSGIDMVAVNYKGGGPAITDVIGGHVTALFAGTSSSTPHIKAGKLRALGVTTVRRSAAMPEVPTIAESGLAGYEVDGWYGVLAPAATPPAIVARFNRELKELLGTAETKERLLSLGIEASASTPAEFHARIERDMKRWAEVVKKAKIPVE